MKIKVIKNKKTEIIEIPSTLKKNVRYYCDKYKQRGYAIVKIIY